MRMRKAVGIDCRAIQGREGGEMHSFLKTMPVVAGLLFAITAAGSEEIQAVYCRSESVMGTNFKSEKCYDETGIRELVRAQRETKAKMDQMRAICGQTGSCGGGT